MTDIKRDIKATMQALYPEAIAQAEKPAFWNDTEVRQRCRSNIETAITGLRPWAGEAADLVVAIAESLKLRYDDCTEACLYLTMAKLSLERLDVGYQVEGREELEALEALSRKADRRMP